MIINHPVKSHGILTRIPKYEYNNLSIDTNLPTGPIFNGTTQIGEYKIFGRLLRVEIGLGNEIRDTHHFIINNGVAEWYGYSNYSSWTVWDANDPTLQNLTKFLKDPRSLSYNELVILSDTVFKPQFAKELFRNVGFQPSFTYTFFKKCLDYPTPSIEQFLSTYSDSYNFYQTFNASLDSGYIEHLIDNLDTVWVTLTFELKSTILARFGVGNSKALTFLVDIISRYLDEIKTKDFWTQKPYILSLFPIVKKIATSIGISKDIKNPLIVKLLKLICDGDFYNYAADTTLLFLYESLIRPNGISIDNSIFVEQIKMYINRLMNNNVTYYTIVKTYNLLGEYADTNHANLIKTLNQVVGSYSNHPMERALLLSALNWNIETSLKERIKSTISLLSWKTDSLDTIQNTLEACSIESLSSNLTSNDFKNLASNFVSKFGTRDNSDTFIGGYDTTLQKVIRLLKMYPTEYRNHFLPLLALFNPQQPSESPTAYQTRLSNINNLFVTGGIFVYDLRGGCSSVPKYISVINEFSITHKNWVDLIVLAVNESGEGKAGAVQLNWQIRYTNPYIFNNGLLHEGVHSFHSRTEYNTRLLDYVVEHWFYEHKEREMLDYTTEYAVTNIYEYVAEIGRYLFQDGEYWIKEAVRRYILGHEGMLNVMMVLLELSGRKLYKLLDDGLSMPISSTLQWVANMKTGASILTLGDSKYNMTWRDYKITKVTINGVTPQPDPDPEPVPEPIPQPEPIPEPIPEPQPEPINCEEIKKQLNDALLENIGLKANLSMVTEKVTKLEQIYQVQINNNIALLDKINKIRTIIE